MSVGSGGGLGTVYSRLPQSTSDVETSEDEVSQHENLIFYRKIGTPKKGKMKQEEESKPTMKDYQPLGNEGGPIESHEVHINGFSNINYNYAQGAGGNGIEEETMVMGPLGASESQAKKKDGSMRHGNGNLQMLVGNKHPMSMMRQVAFVMSLCLCIFVIVAFLWVLPCNWSTCPIMRFGQQASSWEKPLLGLEVLGRISVVPSGNDRQNNLLFMVRGEVAVPEYDKKQESLPFTKPMKTPPPRKVPAPMPVNGGGLVVLSGLTGVVVWIKYLIALPRDIDCSLVDLDGDGKVDCILTGHSDMLYAFNPIVPTNLWFLDVGDLDFSPMDMDFPLILPDIDGDNVTDLAISCRIALKNSTETSSANLSRTPHNRIAVVSGKTGRLLGKYFVDDACTTISRLALDSMWSMTYGCADVLGAVIFKNISVITLYKNVTGLALPASTEKHKTLKQSTQLKQHIYPPYAFPEYSSSSGERKMRPEPYNTSVAGRKLRVANSGLCPDNCHTQVHIFEDKKNSANWSDGGLRMYAMRPATLLFSTQTPAPTLDPLDPNPPPGTVSGFAMKFWHWTECEKSSKWSKWPNSRRQKRMITEKDLPSVSKPLNLRDDRSSRSRDPAKKPPDYVESRESRMGPNGINTTIKTLSANSSTVTVTFHPKEIYKKHCVKERVVLLTFNGSVDMHLVNASENEMKQLCSSLGCQPSITNQEDSLLMADLDGDGSKELVSYSTTYDVEEDDKDPQSYRLTLLSKVRVVRLEAELPQLFKAVTHF